MNEAREWGAHRHWHELLDALCVEQGHPDNMALADALCAASGNRTQAAFDTALKNLRNWRHGVHIPQRKNFILLGKILKVDRYETLREHWNRLYGAAKVKPSDDTESAGILTGNEAPSQKPNKRWRFAAGAVIVLGVGLSAVALWPNSAETYVDPAASLEGLNADYVRNVSVQVGDAVVIHGARGNNCGDAPSWESAKDLLPTLVTGTLSDGGLATRFSRQCGGRIPARAILFTATTAGAEQTTIYGDEVHIRVRE